MKNKIIISIGFLFTSFIIWNRFLRIRLPKSIFDTPSNLRILILSILCIFYISVIIYTIRQIYNIEPKPTSFMYKFLVKIIENKYYLKLNQITKEYIIDAPKILFKAIYIRIKARFVILIIGSYLTLFTFANTFLLFMITMIIPRIIVVIIFLIDIFYFQYFDNFYKSLILLALPLFFYFLIYFIGYTCEEAMVYIKEYVEFYDNETKIKFKDKNAITIIEDPVVERTDDSLLWFTKEWKINTIIHYNLSLKIYRLNEEYKNYIRLFTYSGYFIGWSYYLFIIHYFHYSFKLSLIVVFIIVIINVIALIYPLIKSFKVTNKISEQSKIKETLKEYLIFDDFHAFCLEHNIHLYIILLIITTIVINVFSIYVQIQFIKIIIILLIYNIFRLILYLIKPNLDYKSNIKDIYNWFYDRIVIRPFIIKQGNFLVNKINKRYKWLYSIIIIPRIIIILTFIYTITQNKYWILLYAGSLLLFISFMFQVYIYIINDLSKKNIEYMEIDLNIYNDNNILKFNLKDPDNDLDLQDYIEKYIEVFNIYNITNKIIAYIQEINRYLDIIIALTYIIICIYLIAI